MSEERLWIVCPSYTDVAAFSMLRKRVLDLVRDDPLLDRPVRFVVVDDTAGCDDEIVQLGAYEDVMVVTPPFNLGHQRAIVCGLRVIEPELQDSDLVVTMDSDGEDRPEDLPRLLEQLINGAAERNRVCVAWRTKRHESFGFRVMYFFFRIMFRSLTGVTVRSGNYAAYRGWTARRMLLHPYFDLCYSSTLVSLDLALTRVPCERGERYAGRSRMSLSRLLMHGVRMLMPFTDRIALRALTAFTATFGLSILVSLVVLAIKIFTSSAIPGWATATLLGILILSFLALSNAVVLFVVFSESRGVSLTSLEAQVERSARSTPAPPD